ncbi:MAG: glutamate ligase domain-containing protein, partial [Rhizobacter sp.]
PGCEVVCFALDAAHPAFVEHLGSGGRGVYAQDGMVMLANGDHRIPVVEARRLPFTLNGCARFNMENALAAIAALLALGIARDRIAAELASFTSNAQQNPLRMNLFCAHGVTLLVDYAHNASAYRAIAETGRQLANGRVIGVAAAPGDRRDDDLHEIGRVCREGFDELVFYEMDEVRDRPLGATAARLDEGARRVPGRAAPRIVLDVRHAIREAFLAARPGDALVLGCASHLDDVKEALAGLADIASVNMGEMAQEDASDAAPHLTEEAVGADA